MADDGAFCPLIQDECLKAKCKLWLVEEMTNTQTGERQLRQDCLFVHSYHLMRQGVLEQIRTIATVDKAAAATDKVTATLTNGLALALARRAAREAMPP